MAQFGQKATDLGAPNTPYFIKQGVVDQSSAIGISALGDAVKMGVTAYEEKQKYDLREAQNQNIQHFEESIKTEELTKQAVPSISLIENVWGSFDSGVDKIEAVNEAEKSLKPFKTELNKLTLAKEQGLLSADAFIAKNTALVRAAVTKNPWMEAELYKQANAHLAALGITSLLDAREKAQSDINKEEKEYRTFLRGRAAALNVETFQGEPIQELEAKVNEKTRNAAIVQGIKDKLAGEKAFTELEGVAALKNGTFAESANLLYQDHADGLRAAIAENPNNFGNILLDFELQSQKTMQSVRAKYGAAGMEGPLKVAVDAAEQDYKDLYKLMREAGTGELALARMKARTEFQDTVQKYNFNKNRNPYAVKHAADMANILNLTRVYGSDEQYKNRINSLIRFMDTENVGILERDENVESSAIEDFTNLANQAQGSFGKRETQVTFSRVLSEVNEYIERNPEKASIGVGKARDVLAVLAKKGDEVKGGFINPEFARGVTQAVSTSMKANLSEMMDGIQKVEALPTNKGKEVILDVLPGGSFIIKTGDPRSDEVMNRLYANNINNALDSYAIANGYSRSQAAFDFYKEHFAAQASDPDLVNNAALPNTPEEVRKITKNSAPKQELKIQSPEQAKAALDSGRITKREYNAIIKEGFN